MVRIGILASTDSWYAKDLARAAKGTPSVAEFRILAYTDLQAGLIRQPGFDPAGRLEIRCGPSSDPAHSLRVRTDDSSSERALNCVDLDILLVRTMPLGSLESVIFRMDCLQALDASGVTVLNPPKCLETAIDKWLTLHRLHMAGVPTPSTIVCQNRDAALLAFEQLGGDVLVKPIFGGEGRGIIRVQDLDTAWRVFGTLQQIGQVLYIQQFLDHWGYDLRVFKIGEQIHCIKRFGPSGHWRTNITQGGRAEPHSISAEELEMANRCAHAVGGSVLGIDLLPLRDGGLVALEVNAIPGWKGLSQALDLDVAAKLINHAIELHQSR